MWHLRKRYGDKDCFVTAFEDGTSIPWRPLTCGDFIYYTQEISTGRIPHVVLEDEIFRKCVLSSAILDNIDNLKAGTVSAVVEIVLKASGPESIEDFNKQMDSARAQASAPMNQMAALIVQAFPSYKLEDVYSLDYNSFILRLAQAEAVLMERGLLKSKISLVDPSEAKKPKSKPVPGDLKGAWERSQGPKEPEPKSSVKIPPIATNAIANESNKPIRPPVSRGVKPLTQQKKPEEQTHAKIDFDADNKELMISGGVSGWDKFDMAIKQKEMIELAKKVYPNLFKPSESATNSDKKVK